MEDAAALVAAFPDIWLLRPAVVASIRPEHMYGALWRVRAPAVAGSVVDPAVLVSVEELSAACSRYGRVLFATTPSFLEKALLHPDFASLKGSFAAIVTSGSLLRGETSLAVAAAVGCCPTEIFGSTETGTVAFRRRTEGESWRVVDNVVVSRSDDGRLVVDSPFAMERPYTMGDVVEAVSPREFRLVGRADRRVKILERYVSLTEVEAALAAHPFVSRVRAETTDEAVPRLGALAVLSSEGVAALASGTYASVAARLRRDLMAVSGTFAFPRRIRFVRELPFNEQGKTTAAAARAALSAWCQEPATLSWRATDGELSARLVFPPDAECFRGHFPGFPVLPGVAQLFFLRHFSRQAFADFPETVTYRRLKFQKIILPSREVTLSVTRRDAGAFAFSITGSSGPCSSGIVERTSSS
jgi:acyl-coenzyme A synthetase/AMP-(fatty) acid ligase